MIQNSDLQFLGAKNYLLSPGIETGRQGWGLFNTTLTSKIPTGSITAGAASITTFAPTSTSPLSGDYSLRVASTGAVTAGHGFISDSFTIDRQDKAKVMGWSFSYEAISGTMDFSGTSANTWAVYIYDVDGAAWIQPAGVYNLTQSSGVGIASGTFQTTATGTQYRIAVVCITATGGAVEVRFDSFQAGPQKVLQGPSGPVGEIIAFGSLTPPVGFLYCDGSAVSRTAYSDLFKAIGTSYGVGDGSTTFNLPNLQGVFARGAGSQTISGTIYTGTLGTTQGDQFQGHYHSLTNNNLVVRGVIGGPGSSSVSLFSTTAQTVGYTQAVQGPTTDGTNGTPRTGSETRPANVAVAYHIRYLATYQMSSDTDTRVVAMSASGVGGAVTANVTNIPTTTTTLDTHASWSGSVYTVPVSGSYQLFGSGAGPSNASFFAYIDGVSTYEVKVANGTNASGAISYVLPNLRAGQTISIRSNVSQTLTNFALAITRISGPSTIASSETVAAKYWATASQTISAATRANYDGKIYDTHNAVTTGASWVFTAPISGRYRTSLFLNNSAAVTGNPYIDLYIDGSAYQGIALIYGLAGTGTGSSTVYLNAGQTIQIRASGSYPMIGAATISNASRPCYIDIERIGN
jgi:microcystin-dependent protein